jgi:hypothetical protein
MTHPARQPLQARGVLRNVGISTAPSTAKEHHMTLYTVIGTRERNGNAIAVAILPNTRGVLPIDDQTWIELVEANSVHEAWSTATARIDAA